MARRIRCGGKGVLGERGLEGRVRIFEEFPLPGLEEGWRRADAPLPVAALLGKTERGLGAGTG